jgi:Flp pilus assembly protein protease CpaA
LRGFFALIEILSLLVLALFIIATYTDLRWREVPDWLSFAGIIGGVGIHIIFSLADASITPLLGSLAGLAGGSAIGIGLYTLGQWGGGDAKALMAAGSILGFSLSWTDNFASFLVNLLIVGGIYGTIWTLGIALMDYRRVHHAVRTQLSSRGIMIPQLSLLTLSLVPVAMSLIFFDELVLHLFALVIGITPAFFYFLLIVFREVERLCFVKLIPLAQLTEGDWLAKEVRIGKKIVCSKSSTGITKKQIAELQSHNVRSVHIKSGMPFLPAFLGAFLVTLAFGNVILLALG